MVIRMNSRFPVWYRSNWIRVHHGVIAVSISFFIFLKLQKISPNFHSICKRYIYIFLISWNHVRINLVRPASVADNPFPSAYFRHHRSQDRIREKPFAIPLYAGAVLALLRSFSLLQLSMLNFLCPNFTLPGWFAAAVSSMLLHLDREESRKFPSVILSPLCMVWCGHTAGFSATAYYRSALYFSHIKIHTLTWYITFSDFCLHTNMVSNYQYFNKAMIIQNWSCRRSYWPFLQMISPTHVPRGV